MAESQAQTTDVCEETSVDDGTKVLPKSPEKEAKIPSTEDSELDELLNSALQDFGKNKEIAAQQKELTQQAVSAAGGACAASEVSSQDPTSAEFAEEFSTELAAQFEEAMKSFLSHDPHMLEQIEKLAEAAGNAGDSAEAQQHFASTLSQTLADLAQNAEGIELGEEEELAKAFGGAGAEGQAEDLMPMMQGLMQSLLSKDILYPSLKEISSKYPEYLGANESSLDATQLDMYRKQYELMTSICTLFEEESPEDTQEQKSQRFEKLIDLMQQMQELGQPPKEIVGEMAPGLEFDENGMPKMPGVGSQCSLM